MREVARVGRFIVVGLANTAIYTATYLAFFAAGVTYLLASILGFAVAISAAYWLNHRFTFRAADHTWRLVGQFLAVQVTAAVLNVVLLAVAVERGGLSPIEGQLLVVPPVVVASFVLNRLVVFRPHVDTRTG